MAVPYYLRRHIAETIGLSQVRVSGEETFWGWPALVEIRQEKRESSSRGIRHGESQMAKRCGKRHSPEQIVQKLRDGDAMLNAGEMVTELV